MKRINSATIYANAPTKKVRNDIPLKKLLISEPNNLKEYKREKLTNEVKKRKLDITRLFAKGDIFFFRIISPINVIPKKANDVFAKSSVFEFNKSPFSAPFIIKPIKKEKKKIINKDADMIARIIFFQE